MSNKAIAEKKIDFSSPEFHGDVLFGPKKSPTFETIPDFYWIESIDKYFHKHTGELYTDDEITFMAHTFVHETNDYSFNELMQIFPEAKAVAKRHLKEEQKQHEKELVKIENIKQEIKELLDWKCKKESRWFWESVAEGILIDPLMNNQDKKIKRISFFIASIDRKEEVQGNGVSKDQIERAKQVPIGNFIKVNHAGKALCPFHQDKNPSMHVYKDNHFYCFVCSQAGDVVDLVMHLNRINFITAVKQLA